MLVHCISVIIHNHEESIASGVSLGYFHKCHIFKHVLFLEIFSKSDDQNSSTQKIISMG